MRILVTGGTGFIGTHVVRELLARGHAVCVLTRTPAAIARLDDVLDRIDIIVGEYESTAAGWKHRLGHQEIEGCIHLAWTTDPETYRTSPENLTCLSTSLTLVQALGESGCERFVGVGSCDEYQANAGWLREDAPIHPDTLYASTKASLGLVGAQLATLAGMRFVWARVFDVYGEGEDERRLVPSLIRSILRDRPFEAASGEQHRDYLHVRDVSTALATLMESDARGTYNVASAAPVTVRHLVQTVAGLAGKPHLMGAGRLTPRPLERLTIAGDNQRLRDLGWSTELDLHQGLKAALDWWSEVH